MKALPERVVLKDSWPLELHTNEGTMFNEVSGEFGVPDVLDSYDVEDGMVDFILVDAMYWDVFLERPVERQICPEKRRHH